MTQPATPRCRRTVTYLTALLLIVAASYATAAQPRGPGVQAIQAPEIAPLPPSLTHQTYRDERALAPAAIAEQSRRLELEVFGDGTDLVGGVPHVCAAGGSDFDNPPQHRGRCLEKLRQLHQRMKNNRLDRRAARIHRRATTTFLERITQRRRAH